MGAKAKSGQKILVTGAAGNVGRAAVYTAAQAGALVIAGVRSKSREALSGLPLAAGIVDLESPDGIAAAGPYDAVADTVGGRLAERLAKHMRPGGVLASVVSPSPLPPTDSPASASPVWVMFDGPRLQRFLDDMLRNKWTMPIAHRFKLTEVSKAHALMDAGSVGGKIILIP